MFIGPCIRDDFFSQYDQREVHDNENIQDDDDDDDAEYKVQPQESAPDQQYMITRREKAQLIQNVVKKLMY